MGSKRRYKNSDVEVAKSKMADLVFICLIEQDVTVEDETCITGGSDPEVTIGGKLIAKVLY
jgi:hypothetical protein